MLDDPKPPLTSFHWGTFRVETRDGKVSALRDFEQDIDPSPIGQGIIDVLDGPTRITKPMIRESWLNHGPGAATEKRGADRFVAVDWPTAERLVAAELERVRNDHGNEAIFGGSYGWASAGRFHHAQSQLKRFLNCIGGFTRSVHTYSFCAAEVAMPHIIGDFRSHLYPGTEWRSVIGNTRLLVAFGGMPLKNAQISQGGTGRHRQREAMLQAKAAGIEFVSISPIRQDVLDELDAEWLAPRPSTDTAIILSLCHTLLDENLHDLAFLERYTVGFPRFADYLLGKTDGQPKTAEWAAGISGLTAETLRNLARRMAAVRTMISLSWSLTRQDHGEQPMWAGIALASMLGHIGLPGGGFAFGYSAVNSVGNEVDPLPAAPLPQGRNPVEAFIPVARIADMLLHPGEPFEFDGGHYRYPDIRLIYWAGGNPFHHHQDLNRLVRAWRKPDTVIVHEWCWNALAKHADIVLPCTTPIERDDIAMSPRDPFVVSMSKAVEPAGEARDDYEIFRGIALNLGVEAQFSEGRSVEDWLRWMHDVSRQQAAAERIELPPYETVRREGWVYLKPSDKPRVMLETFRADPEANPLKTPSGRIELFSETIAGFGYDDCPPHPSWLEPAEWLGKGDARHPLHLISNQPVTKLHSQLDHGSHSRAAKIDGREPITIHPDDAGRRGIAHHQLVRVFNERGACICAAVLSEAIRPGVVQLATGAWFDPEHPGEAGTTCKHGNPNVLTLDKGTSRLAQGPTAHSCLVDIAPLSAPPPQVTAFEPPEIVSRDGTSQKSRPSGRLAGTS